MSDIEKIVDMTINKTILKLKMTGLMRDDRKTAFQKTEELLKNYNAFIESDQPYTIKLVEKMNAALEGIKDDPYFEIIPMCYFEDCTREEIAEKFNTTVTTVSRNKTRLVNILKSYLFSDDVIYELFL